MKTPPIQGKSPDRNNVDSRQAEVLFTNDRETVCKRDKLKWEIVYVFKDVDETNTWFPM